MLYQTLFLAVSVVFAEALDSFFQLAITSTILVAGLALLMLLQPLHDPLLQNMQVCPPTAKQAELVARLNLLKGRHLLNNCINIKFASVTLGWGLPC